MNRVLNMAEGSLRDCSECIYNQANPELQKSCRGLWVSWGVANCNSQDDEAGMTQAREGASIESAGTAGFVITFDEKGLLTKGQYRVQPSLRQRLLARAGINQSMWHPDDI